MTRAQREVIEAVRLAQRLHRCHCKLRAGMTRAQLDALGAGCKDPYFVCPALDAYRRRVHPEPHVEAQVKVTKPRAWRPEDNLIRRSG